ncbi:UDP-N-acetylglucosamine 2-epimerase [bacterium]|nr:UDP-N-acetylglucosamine 2-epimerase [bacterium]
MKTKICVVSSSRADYGLLKSIILEIDSSEFFDLQLIVTGSHLSKKHGFTIEEIINDNLKIDKEIPIIIRTNTKEDIGLNVGRAVTKMIKSISNLQPNIVLLLGDRYEIFSTAIASFFLNIPIVHIHGGEVTEGAIDDMIRHSITKLSHIHFASTLTHKKRIIQMGEQPKNVYNVGALGVENLKKIKLLNVKALEKEIQFKFQKKNIIVTYHPVTLDEDPIHGIDILLDTLNNFKHIGIIFTYSNADISGTEIIRKIIKFQKQNPNSKVYSSLGQLKYLSCLKQCNGMIGNSSSGIIEAPSLKTWTINIGNRQKGRIKAESVFDVKADKKQITAKLNDLLNQSNSFQKINYKNPYNKNNTTKIIIDTLKKINKEKIVNKSFFDIQYTLKHFK